MKTILLTGASGFLGKQYHEHYIQKGWKVLTIGRHDDDDVFWDATLKRDLLASDFHLPIHRIVHCAAVNETQIIDNLNTTYDVNVTLTRALCQLALTLNVPEFIYVSTFHVYGVSEGEIEPALKCNPLNDYGLTHYLSEEIIRNIFRNNSIAALCVRPTNIYGIPASFHKFDRWSLVPFAFIRSGIDKQHIRLNTPGSQYRNFVDVRDVLEAEPSNEGFEARDIYGDDTLTVKEFARLVISILKEEHDLNVVLEFPQENEGVLRKNTRLVFKQDKDLKEPKRTISTFVKNFSELYRCVKNV